MNTVAIAGSTGFVGRALLKSLSQRGPVVALSRSQAQDQSDPGVDWRQADFFSVDSLAHALRGCRVAVYLIHSMMPTARLDQSRFEDTDLWLADTFAQAAALAGVERIIYLGGLVPRTDHLSLHLRSRREVEQALASSGRRVITLRAGLVLGAEGSSFQMLYLLVKRLPWMLCPQWAWTRTQPIALEDVVTLIEYCITHPELDSGAYDIGGPEVTTYRQLMLECARLLGLKRRIFNVPLFTPGLSTLWVCLITGASRNLAAPLVLSLTQPMLVHDRRLIEAFGRPLEGASAAVKRALTNAAPQLRRETRSRHRARAQEHWVRSIQRLQAGPDWDAGRIADEYFSWLSARMSPWVRIVNSDEDARFYLRLWKWERLLLRLKRRASGEAHWVRSYSVAGGALTRLSDSEKASGQGAFEFRVAQSGDYALVGLHGFSPRLPWMIYKFTQAVAHLLVMRAFGRALAARVRRMETEAGEPRI